MSVVGRCAAAVVFFLVAGLMPSALAITSNDDFANAVAIEGASGTTSGSTSGYTSQASEPNHAPPNTGGASAWFAWTAPSTGRFRFDTTGSTFDTMLAVYTGNDIASLSPVRYNDDRFTTMSTPKVSMVGVNAIEGTVYRIVIDGKHNGTSAAQGSYTLNWKPGPANDDFADATLIEGTSGELNGTLVGSTKQQTPAEPTADPVDRYTVWYRYIPATNGMLTLRNNRFGADLTLGLYSGSHGSLTQVGLHNNSFNPTRVDKNVTAGTTYHIMVASPSEDTFPLTWSLGPPLTNDDVAGATVLPGESGNTAGSTVGATRVSNPQEIGGSFGTTTVWYKWQTSSTLPVTFEAGGGSYGVAAFQTPQGACTNPAVCWNNKNMFRDAAPRIQFTPVANQEYWIQVSGHPPGGPFTLKWARPPSHDLAATPAVVTGQTGSQQSNNLSASKEQGELNHAGNAGGSSVWFSWTAPSSDPIEFDTYGSDFDTLLAVYPGGNPTGAPLASNNDFTCCQDKSSRVGFDPTAGSTYLIVVDGAAVNSPGSMSGISASIGNIVLNWNASPTNDDFAQRQLIEGTSGTVNLNTVGATREANESTNHGASVWYRWVAPGAGRLEVTTAGTPAPDRASIYSGNALNSLQQNMSGGRTDTVYGNVTEGTEYSIAVFHDEHVTGPMWMSWQFVPAPVTEIISGPTGTVNTSTVAFEFGPNTQNMAFLCTLNGRTIFQCPRLLTLDNLLNGEYTLIVRATDGSGTQDPTPEQRTWTVNAPPRERLDGTFDGEGVAVTDFPSATGQLNQVAVTDDGKVIAVGTEAGSSNAGAAGIARYLPNGSPDLSFAGDGTLSLDIPCSNCQQPTQSNQDAIKAAIPVAGNKLLVAGDAVYYQQQQCFLNGDQYQCFISQTSRRVFVARLNEDGTLDTTFGTNGYRFYQESNSTLADAELRDGKLYLAGTTDTGVWKPFVGVLALDGTPDPTFDSDGFAINNTDAQVTDLSVFAGKPVISAQPYETAGFWFAQYNAAGALDSSFGGGDGSVTHQVLANFDIPYALAHDSQGRIVAGGRTGGSPHHSALVRMLPNGDLDTTFNPCGSNPAPCGGKLRLQLGSGDSQVRDLLTLPNDKIVVASKARGPNDVFFLSRLLPSGSYDTTFSGDGQLTTGWTYQAGAFIEDLARDTEGRILAGGTGSGVGDFVVARYTADPKRQVSVTITGNGSVASAPGGISCSSGTCNGDFEDGSNVTLTATPGQHQKFDGWTGDCSNVNGTTCTISSIAAAKNVTATFSQITHDVNVTVNGTGSVSSDPAGISCPSTCSHAFNQGQQITLTATPGENKQFNGWSGDCSTTNAATCTVNSLAAARNITANFGPKIYAVTVDVNGNGLGDVASNQGGINCPTGPCTASFAHGSDVTLLAFPRNSNYRFVSWSGCTSTNGAQCFVEGIASAKQITATFGLTQYPVGVTLNGSGTGLVSSSPTGISCTTGTCSAPFDKGTTVVLTATPGSNQAFDGWTSCPAPNGTTCTLDSITEAKSVTATFSQIKHNVSVTINGNGAVTSDPAGISCPTTCTHAFNQGGTVILTAAPGTNQKFDGWTNCPSPSAATCTLSSIGEAKSVTATFSQIKHNVSVTINGNGAVTSDPAGISCPTTCAHAFNQGETVTLSATPGTNQHFNGWTNCPSSSGTTCTIDSIGEAKSVTATFSQIQHMVYVTVNGSGTVTRDPGGVACTGSCNFLVPQGNSFTLTAAPHGSGWVFDGWTGDCSSTDGATCTITSIAQQSYVTATFARYRTDVHVKKAADSSYIGDNIYSANGQDQTVSMNATRGSSKTFNFKLQNDGTGLDAYEVSGPGDSSGFTVKYFLGKENITTKLVNGKFKPQIEPGAAKVLKVTIAVKSGAPIGARKSVLLTALSTGGGSVDMAKAQVKVVRG